MEKLQDETALKVQVKELIDNKEFNKLRHVLSSMQPADIAEAVFFLDEKDDVILFRLLPLQLSIEVFEYLDIETQKNLLTTLKPAQLSKILNEMAPDDRTSFLEGLSPVAQKEVIKLLSDDERKVTLSLLNYPEYSVGRIMTIDYIVVKPEWTIDEALQFIRLNAKKSETIEAIYVTDSKGMLVDDLMITELLLHDPFQKIQVILDNKFSCLEATTDQEEAVKIFRKYHRVALPVVDKGFLIGIVTVDDILAISREEDTEDIQKMGGSEALDEPYLEISNIKMIKKRAGWLIILFLGEMLTATAMAFFEDEIAKAVVLALFVPLIISSGGNSGSQATTLIIRAMALGEVRLKDWWRVMRRELISGLSLGVILGSIGFMRIFVWTFFSDLYGPHWLLIALSVGASLVGVVLWGSLTGSMLPFLLRKIKLDPATSSAPFVATLVDVTGLIIYFSFAFLFLKGTLL